MATVFVGVGCEQNKQQEPQPLVEILQDEVVVDHSLVQTSIPERYQPSFNLQGALIPVDQVEIESTYPVLSASILVIKGDKVEQGQPLLKVDTKIVEDKIPFVSNEFIDVYVNGEQIIFEPVATLGDSKDLETVIDANRPKQSDLLKYTQAQKNSVKENSAKEVRKDTATNSGSDSTKELIPVTLVYKAPIEGSIINTFDPKMVKGHINNKNKKIDANSETNVDKANKIDSSSPVITVANVQELQLVGKLPLATQSQLAVGNPVYFTVHELHKEFTGQISDVITHPKSKTLTVKAPLVSGENSKALLKPGMQASMQIDYGQIELGVRLPRVAIHEAKLDELTKKKPRPNSPIKGYVWIIEQDQTLSYTPIEVVQYFADSEQFLVSGISNESLVCLADLPKNLEGKTVSVD